MSPLVTGYLLVTVVVAVWSCIARQRTSRNFALYNLANSMVCIVLDHTVSAAHWSEPFAFMDAFAGCAAIVVALETRCKWLFTLGAVYLLQCGLYIGYAGELISEHGVMRPMINALFLAGNAALVWGILRPSRRARGYSV